MRKRHPRETTRRQPIRDEDLRAVTGGRASHADLPVVKRVDASSSKLLLACASGAHFPAVVL